MLIHFAKYIGVTYTTICDWRKKYPEFHHTIKECQEYQKYLLVANGLAGRYDRTLVIFMLKNLWKWMEVSRDDNWRDDLRHDHAADGQTMTEFLQGMWERAQAINPQAEEGSSSGATR